MTHTRRLYEAYRLFLLAVGREPIPFDLWLARNPTLQSSPARTWSCGWSGSRCLRFNCPNTGPCDGFRSDIEFDYDKETRGDAQ
jgi:hypothetical protein